jgi:hypothetical protein
MLSKSLLVSLALAAASVHADLYISTPPELKQCEEATFVIKGANGPVWPFVVNPTAPCDDPYRELDDVTGDLKWKPDLPVGTSVQLAIEDEAGNEAWSGALTIKPGSDSSCVPSNSSNPTSLPPTTPATTSQVKSPAASILGGTNNTPQNAANSNTGGAPARVLASGGVAVFTVLSAVALTL